MIFSSRMNSEFVDQLETAECRGPAGQAARVREPSVWIDQSCAGYVVLHGLGRDADSDTLAAEAVRSDWCVGEPSRFDLPE